MAIEHFITPEENRWGQEVYVRVRDSWKVDDSKDDTNVSPRGTHWPSKFPLFTSLGLTIRDCQNDFDHDISTLDLGSGSGYVTGLNAHLGCKSYGIEFDREWYRYSLIGIEAAESSGLPMKYKPKIAFGNFFPHDFKVDWRDVRGADFLATNEVCFDSSRESDPYRDLGISPSDIDIFYHFQVQNFKHISEFFSRYAKKGSLLVIGESGQNTYEQKAPTNVHLQKIFSKHFPSHNPEESLWIDKGIASVYKKQ